FTSSKIILKKLEGKLGKGHFTLTGDLYNYMSLIIPNANMIKGDLNLYCDTLDLNPWMATTTVQKGTTDTTHTITTVFEVPRNVEFVFDSDMDVILYEDMVIRKMQGDIKIADGILTLKETGFNSLNALFNISCDYNTQDVKHPLFDMDIDIKELDINKAYKEIKLVRDLAPAMADTYGIFSITYQLKGGLNKQMEVKTETLAGGGELRIADAKVNGMKMFEEISKSAKKKEINDPHLKDLVIKSTIKDNKLKVEPFQMQISGFNAEIEGISNIQGAGTISYLVKLELLNDKIKIPFHVTGTYDNPKVAVGKGHEDPQ
ncbi:MAG TPA: AsmA-like C-terminal region-containing protein, partial [Cytophagaceae bacterium]|nr:AsmA-like C-terminal region-containing protein [Cytophagaceae bacterium]